jgi:transposase
MNTDGMDEFRKDIERISKASKANPLIGCESTGIYHVPLLEYCDKKDLPVRVFNAIELNKYHRSRIRRNRDDRIDTLAIATALLIEGEYPGDVDIPDDVRKLRELTRIRYRILDKITTCKVQLSRDMDVICRGYTRCFKDLFCSSSLEVIRKNVQLTRQFHQTREELEALLKGIGYPDPHRKSKELRDLFDKAVVPKAYIDACVLEIRYLIKQYSLLTEQQQDIEERMSALVESMGTKILSIPGVGAITAAVVLGEIGSVDRFDSPDKLVAFAGLDPSAKDSGQFQNPTRRISKRGSPYLRHALYNAALAASRSNPVCREFAERLKARGKPMKVVFVAVAHKILLMIYSVLKNDREFRVPRRLQKASA